MTGYPRDLVGYADQPPDPRWPGGAHLALNFVVNYEEGGERSVLHITLARSAFSRLSVPLRTGYGVCGVWRSARVWSE
jgi:hypothetical protein